MVTFGVIAVVALAVIAVIVAVMVMLMIGVALPHGGLHCPPVDQHGAVLAFSGLSGLLLPLLLLLSLIITTRITTRWYNGRANNGKDECTVVTIAMAVMTEKPKCLPPSRQLCDASFSKTARRFKKFI